MPDNQQHRDSTPNPSNNDSDEMDFTPDPNRNLLTLDPGKDKARDTRRKERELKEIQRTLWLCRILEDHIKGSELVKRWGLEDDELSHCLVVGLQGYYLNPPTCDLFDVGSFKPLTNLMRGGAREFFQRRHEAQPSDYPPSFIGRETGRDCPSLVIHFQVGDNGEDDIGTLVNLLFRLDDVEKFEQEYGLLFFNEELCLEIYGASAFELKGLSESERRERLDKVKEQVQEDEANFDLANELLRVERDLEALESGPCQDETNRQKRRDELIEKRQALKAKMKAKVDGSFRVTERALSRANELKSTVENLYRLTTQIHKPVDRSSVEALRATAIEIIRDDRSKYRPISSKHLEDDSLFNTLPSKTKRDFCGKLLLMLLREEGYKVENYKKLYQLIWPK